MGNYAVIKKVISGSTLSPGEPITINSKFEESEYTLIKGYVSHNNKPVANAGVIITCIDKKTTPWTENVIGVVFTDENGIYGMSVMVIEKCEYRMDVYS